MPGFYGELLKFDLVSPGDFIQCDAPSMSLATTVQKREATPVMARKIREVRTEAIGAIRTHYGPEDLPLRLLGTWAEPDGAVVLHVNSVETAGVVTHALWRRHEVYGDIHPEYGVLVWVP